MHILNSSSDILSAGLSHIYYLLRDDGMRGT